MLGWLFSKPLEVGTPAPEFSLPDQNLDMVTLSKLRGHNVVLVFYPGDDTKICRQQLCEFRDQWKESQRKNTLVFGINPQGAESHEKFRKKVAIPFPLLVDKGQKTGADYHTRGLIVRRTVYLIDPEGMIRFAERGKPDPAKVLQFAR